MKKWFPLVMVVALAAIGTPLHAGIFDRLVNDSADESIPLTSGGGDIVHASPEMYAPTPSMDYAYSGHGPAQTGYGYPFKTDCCQSQNACAAGLWEGYCGRSHGTCGRMNAWFASCAHGKGRGGKGGCATGNCGKGGCATGDCGKGGVRFGQGFGHVQHGGHVQQKGHVQHGGHVQHKGHVRHSRHVQHGGHVQQKGHVQHGGHVQQKGHVQHAPILRGHVQHGFFQGGHVQHGKGFAGCGTCGQSPCGCASKGHHQKGFGFGKGFGHVQHGFGHVQRGFGKGHVGRDCGCGTGGCGKAGCGKPRHHCPLGLFSRLHRCDTCGKGSFAGGCDCGSSVLTKGAWSSEGNVIWDKSHSYDAPQHGQPTPAYDPPVDLEIPTPSESLPVPSTPTAHSASIRRLPPVTGYQY